MDRSLLKVAQLWAHIMRDRVKGKYKPSETECSLVDTDENVAVVAGDMAHIVMLYLKHPWSPFLDTKFSARAKLPPPIIALAHA